jgi:hypothetical protein
MINFPATVFRARALLTAVAANLALGVMLCSGPARGGVILETATLGPNPQPAIGVAGLQWVGARFSISQTTHVDEIGANLAGVSTLFGAIVPLSGPNGLPAFAPSQIQSFALASTVFGVTLTIQDYSAPLSVTLAPGDYGVVFGVGPFGSLGAANLTSGNIPTAQASFFNALNVISDSWHDQPTFTGLRIFVLGTSVPEPSTWLLLATGAFAAGGAACTRKLSDLRRARIGR